jgi:ArsR family transcriptional regulator, virulence genes transcriptional regulator
LDINERAAIYRLHAEFCKTLADANRLLIISELAKGELAVSELTRRLGLQQSNVSKHLSLMREHGLVTTRRDGSTIYYALADSRISEAIRLLREAQADLLEKRRRLAQSEQETGAEIHTQ